MFQTPLSFDTCSGCSSPISKKDIHSCQCCRESVLCSNCIISLHITNCSCGKKVHCHLDTCDQHVSLHCKACFLTMCKDCVRKCNCCDEYFCKNCYKSQHEVSCVCGNISLCHLTDCASHKGSTCPDCKGKLCYACTKVYCECCFDYFCTDCYFKKHQENCDCDQNKFGLCHKDDCGHREHQKRCSGCKIKICHQCQQDCACVEQYLCQKCYVKMHPDKCFCEKKKIYHPDCITFTKKIEKNIGCRQCNSQLHTLIIKPECYISDCSSKLDKVTICCVHQNEYNLTSVNTCHKCLKQICTKEHSFSCVSCEYNYCLKDVGFWKTHDFVKNNISPACKSCELHIFTVLDAYIFPQLINTVKEYLFESVKYEQYRDFLNPYIPKAKFRKPKLTSVDEIDSILIQL